MNENISDFNERELKNLNLLLSFVEENVELIRPHFDMGQFFDIDPDDSIYGLTGFTPENPTECSIDMQSFYDKELDCETSGCLVGWTRQIDGMEYDPDEPIPSNWEDQALSLFGLYHNCSAWSFLFAGAWARERLCTNTPEHAIARLKIFINDKWSRDEWTKRTSDTLFHINVIDLERWLKEG